MKLVEMKCKNCGAKLEVNDEDKEAKCKYCNASFKIDDEAKHIQYDNAEQTGYDFEKGRMRAKNEIGQTTNQSNSSSETSFKSKHPFLTSLIWLCFFPFLLTYYVIKSDKLDTKKKVIIIAAMWLLFVIIGATAEDDSTVSWEKECTKITDFDYSIDGDNLVLKEYNGSSKNIKICSKYKIENKDYSVTSFSDGVFTFDNVKSVILPEGLKSMPDDTFNSSDLKYIYIPKTLEKNDRTSGFYTYFHDMEKIYYGGTEKEWKNLTDNTDRSEIDAKEIIYNVNVSDLIGGK